MTTVLDIKSAAKSFTGDLTGVMFTDADLLRYINYGVTELGRRTRSVQNVLIGTNATLSSLDQYGGVLLPADFIAELDVYYGQGSGAQRLARIPLATFSTQFLQTTAAQPSGYTISDYMSTAPGQRLMLFYPALTPGLTGQYFRINYVSKGAAMAIDGDVVPLPPFFDEVLVMYVVKRCKMQEDDFASAQFYGAEIEKRLAELTSEFADHSDLSFYTIRDESTPVYTVFGEF